MACPCAADADRQDKRIGQMIGQEQLWGHIRPSEGQRRGEDGDTSDIHEKDDANDISDPGRGLGALTEGRQPQPGDSRHNIPVGAIPGHRPRNNPLMDPRVEDQFEGQAESLKGNQPRNGAGDCHPLSQRREAQEDTRCDYRPSQQDEAPGSGFKPSASHQDCYCAKPDQETDAHRKSQAEWITPLGLSAGPHTAEERRHHDTANNQEGAYRRRRCGLKHMRISQEHRQAAAPASDGSGRASGQRSHVDHEAVFHVAL